MFVTLTVFCSTEERALQCGVQLAAGGSLPNVQNHPAAADTSPLPTCFFRAPCLSAPPRCLIATPPHRRRLPGSHHGPPS
jgi:hypothetical protein